MVLKNSEKKEICTRHHEKDETIEDIAKAMNISPTTVSKYKDYGLESVNPSETENIPGWAKQMGNKINTLSEQFNNQVPQTAAPSLEQPASQHVNQIYQNVDEEWMKNFLALYSVPHDLIRIIIREMQLNHSLLPEVSDLRNRLFSWNKNLKYTDGICDLYTKEIRNRYAPAPSYNPNLQQQQPLAGMTQQPIIYQQQPPTDLDRMDKVLEMFLKINGTMKPNQQQQQTPEQTAALVGSVVKSYLDHSELDMYREGKLGNKSVSVQDVDMEKVRSDYLLALRQEDDKKSAGQKWTDMGNRIVEIVAPAAAAALSDGFAPGQMPPGQMPPGQIASEKIKGRCPFCKSELEGIPNQDGYITCPSCGKILKAELPPESELPIGETIPEPIPENHLPPISADIPPVDEQIPEENNIPTHIGAQHLHPTQEIIDVLVNQPPNSGITYAPNKSGRETIAKETLKDNFATKEEIQQSVDNIRDATNTLIPSEEIEKEIKQFLKYGVFIENAETTLIKKYHPLTPPDKTLAAKEKEAQNAESLTRIKHSKTVPAASNADMTPPDKKTNNVEIDKTTKEVLGDDFKKEEVEQIEKKIPLKDEKQIEVKGQFIPNKTKVPNKEQPPPKVKTTVEKKRPQKKVVK